MAQVGPLVWMLGAGIGSTIVAVLAGAPPPEVVWGVAGPLVSACVTWLLVTRTLRRAPDALTGVMMKAFAGKMLFFGAYVVAVLRGLALDVTPFAVAFTACFIAVYVMEALFLQRLFVGTGLGTSPGTR